MPAEQPKVRRSRLSPERERELLDTALRLVRERGYDKVTIDDIAEAARASVATLYRRWDSKAKLIITAIQVTKPESAAGIDTGSLRGDLLAVAERAAGPIRLRDPGTATMTGLARDALLDPELMRAMRDILVEPEVEVLRAVLRRHAEAGRIAADSPVLDIVDRLIFGPLLFEQLFAGDAPGLPEHIVDDVLLPLLIPGGS
ncbi:TetR/AcrR family transcriptional regulator [Actinoplanes sp. NPDC049596]|uniref:TetR/AcrR family transcriptional regulator n=1 Tax=unclassified Actinoplanes TaxID=2626549 RepID=UPI00343C283A